ncbi:MAG: homocysteine S-methyltransferase family protein [Methylacidiphilales bacterium]|nr:homocysteine S-methyltransferase family protein [Candidatus Methylacidiphilales bacterium]
MPAQAQPIEAINVHPFIEKITAAGPVLSDGAWGTQLQSRGLAPGEVPDLWNLIRPETVAEVAKAYVDAGAQIILTNTFGANRVRLGEAGAADKVKAVNEAGARISREAAGGNAFVFASMGPSGKLLINEDVTEEELLDAFTEQAQALADGGAQGLVVETMQDLDEARIAIAAAKVTGLPVVACMVFDSGKDKDRTMFGTTPEQAAAALVEAGADVIGANCGQGIAGFVKVCARLKAAADGRPVWIKANAGLPEMREGRATYAMSAAEFADHVPAVLSAGADFIGGCCGTTPEFIRELHRRLHGK